MDSPRDIQNKRWLSTWSQVRKRGFVRYWVIYGLLYFALSFAMIMALIYLFDGPLPVIGAFISEHTGNNILLAFSVGLVISLLKWIINELRYRRLGSKYPNAIRHF